MIINIFKYQLSSIPRSTLLMQCIINIQYLITIKFYSILRMINMRLEKFFKVLLLGSCALLIACDTTSREEISINLGVSVSVAPVILQKITEWDEFTGRISSPESVELRPRVSGFIESMNFKEGSVVNAGDTLFIIDNRLHIADVEHLQAELAEVNSRVELAKSSLDRASVLRGNNSISEELFDRRVADLEQSKAIQRSIAARLEVAQLNLSYTRVLAPISGRVSRAEVTSGNLVKAGDTLLTTIVSLNPMYAYFDADERTYLKYLKLASEGARPSSREVKNPVYLSLSNEGDYPHEGYIDFVDNHIDSGTGTIRGRAVFNNDNGLLIPGLFARIKLIGSGSYDGIMIDDKAIGTDLNNKYVFVVNDKNIVEYRLVKLGEKLNGLRIIKSGLVASDIIIVNGVQRVRPGSLVSPKQVVMADKIILDQLQVLQNQIDRIKQDSGAKQQSSSINNSIVGG